MRFSHLPISPASLVATVLTAATVGFMTWGGPRPAAPPQESGPDAAGYVMYEEVTITAEAEEAPLFVSLRSGRDAWLAGEPIAFEAILRNDSGQAVTVTAASLYELAVQRVGGPRPEGVGGVTYLALEETGATETVVIAPGQDVILDVVVGADKPFDQPGRYRVRGSWLGADVAVPVAPFDVLIDARRDIALDASPKQAPGA